MPSFKIVEKNNFYQGVERYDPPYNGSLEDPEANALFDWFFLTDIDRDYDSVDSEEKTRQVLEIYREVYREQLATSGEAYEIIEVTAFQDKPTKYTHFLGYDIASYHRRSLVSTFLHSQIEVNNSITETLDSKDNPIISLYLLFQKQFCPSLNEYGLFSEREDAYFFCRVMKDFLGFLNSIAFEPPETYEVLGVWRAV